MTTLEREKTDIGFGMELAQKDAPREFRDGSENRSGGKMKRITMLLAVGLILFAATVPATRAFAQSTTVTDDNLDQKITAAKAPADHEAIAAYYEQEAAAAKEKADLHRRSAASYRKMGIDKPVGMAKMCDGIAAMWDKVAADAKDLAKSHHEMAKAAPSGQ